MCYPIILLLLMKRCTYYVKDYVLGDHLGHGQFATVRLARNKHSGEVFAIKIVRELLAAILYHL